MTGAAKTRCSCFERQLFAYTVLDKWQQIGAIDGTTRRSEDIYIRNPAPWGMGQELLKGSEKMGVLSTLCTNESFSFCNALHRSKRITREREDKIAAYKENLPDARAQRESSRRWSG